LSRHLVEGMCTRPHTQVILLPPITAVVARVKFRQRKIGNFIMFVAYLLQPVHEYLKLMRGQIIGYRLYFASVGPLSKNCLGFNGEGIATDMLRLKQQGLLNIFFPAVLILARYAINQVEANVCKTCLAGGL